MRIASLTGAAAILLAGYAGMANAQSPQTHVLTLRLPDGRLEQVRYTGDVPPTIVLSPDPIDAVAFDPGPTDAVAFDSASPFTMLDRMMAAMDRQAEAMFRTINTMNVPGAVGFGMMPALSGPGVCMRSVQITYNGNGQAPQVVSHSAGDCGPTQDHPTPAAVPEAPTPKPAPNVIQVKAATPYPGLVHTISDRPG